MLHRHAALALGIALAPTCFAQTTGIECVTQQILFQMEADSAQGMIASAGSLVAYTSAGDTLNIYEASDPSNPVLLSETPGLGSNEAFSSQLDMSTTLVASSDFFGGISLIDITDPSTPVLRSTIGTTVFFMELDADRLIVHTGSSIEVYDVSDPADPTLLGTASDSSNAMAISLSGSTLCVADRDEGLRLFDLSDPANINQAALFPNDDRTWSVTSSGDTAVMMTASPKNLVFVDISDPGNPVEIPSSGEDVFTRNGGVIVGDKLALTTTTGVQVLDISSLASRSFDRIITGPEVLNPQFIAPLGSNLAMISAGGLSIIDLGLEGPLNSEIFNDTPTGMPANADLAGLIVEGSYGFTHDISNGDLLVLDLSDPLSPTVAASLPVGTSADRDYDSIAINGTTLYTVNSQLVVSVVDVSDPTAPVLLNTFNGWDPNSGAQGNAATMQVSGGVLYILPNFGPLTGFDISDPSNPTLEWVHPLPFSTGVALAASPDRLVMVSHSEGGGSSLDLLSVFDTTDPGSPVELPPAASQLNFLPDLYDGGLEINGHALYVSLGGYLLAGDQPMGSLATYDISGAYAMLDRMIFEPIEDSFNPGASLGEIVTDENATYVATSGSIALFDLTDPSDIRYRGASGNRNGVSSTGSAAIVNKRIYIAAGNNLSVFDASDCSTCPADLTDDGMLDFFDVSAFLGAFTAQDPAGDFNGDGNWNFFDVSAFLGAFSAGCP